MQGFYGKISFLTMQFFFTENGLSLMQQIPLITPQILPSVNKANISWHQYHLRYWQDKLKDSNV